MLVCNTINIFFLFEEILICQCGSFNSLIKAGQVGQYSNV